MNKPLLKWDDSYLIGIEELDFEHKNLIEDINFLHKELAGHDEKSNIEKCLGDIFARLQAHFALEEHVMMAHGYSFYDEHKREHDDLLESYTETMLNYLNSPGTDSGDLVKIELNRWIADHILTSDKKMSAMIKDTSQRSLPTRIRDFFK
jgi:hemerythrin